MRSYSRVLLIVAAGVSLAVLQSCSTVGRITSKGKEGATTDQMARYVSPADPMARPIQVAWTSARASYCGFMFDPVKLKNDYMADESRRGIDPNQLQHISETYDYTRDSVTDTIKADPQYCTKERTDAIRADLKRYLAGDYTPTARLAR
ncbi:MAG TPA: hypothetical protein VED02_04290 [Methyloceanibacter sp.]|jgi:hypothetical protein|nr:hypothetical protein [Methyloceanibacter sp.]